MIYLLISIAALIVLLLSSHLFVDHAVALAKKIKLGTFLIGFVILSLGTSLPELISSTYSSIAGHPQFAIANIIGSNIVNVTLILGIIASFSTFKLSKRDVYFNIPLVFISTLIFVIAIFVNKNFLTSGLGIVFMVVFILLLLLINKENPARNIKGNVKFNIILFIISVIALVFSGKYFIDNLLLFSIYSGISESVIGMFITAIGTSLPELITTIIAIRKGNSELGIGNLLGSNIFNTFFILSICSQISTLDFTLFRIDLVLMVMSLILILLAAFMGKRLEYSKKEGLVLIIFYILFAYIQLNIL